MPSPLRVELPDDEAEPDEDDDAAIDRDGA